MDKCAASSATALDQNENGMHQLRPTEKSNEMQSQQRFWSQNLRTDGRTERQTDRKATATARSNRVRWALKLTPSRDMDSHKLWHRIWRTECWPVQVVDIALQLTVQLNAWLTLASFGDFCRFKLCSPLVILLHIVSDIGLVIWVDFSSN